MMVMACASSVYVMFASQLCVLQVNRMCWSTTQGTAAQACAVTHPWNSVAFTAHVCLLLASAAAATGGHCLQPVLHLPWVQQIVHVWGRLANLSGHCFSLRLVVVPCPEHDLHQHVVVGLASFPQ
jgi:hypothetical protein